MTTIEELAYDLLCAAENDEVESARQKFDEAIEQYAAELVAKAHKPLNFDQLQVVMSAHFGSHELTDDEKDSAEAFARAIERAHGIGEQQNG